MVFAVMGYQTAALIVASGGGYGGAFPLVV